MAGPDRHGRGRRGARHVQEAPHAVIRRLYAASIPRVFQVWEVSGDREYRICRVYSETVYNRCIIKYMPVLRSDVRAGSGGRNRENQNRKFMHSRTHPAPRAPPLPRPPSPGPVCGQPRAPSGGAIERCEVRSAPGVEACGDLKRTSGAAPRGRGGRRAGVRGRTRQPDETGQPARDGHGGAGCAAARSVSSVFCGHIHVV
jgi:hypothetical protein